jgi:HTH-type transcriptional regulator, sugar sensing transcriptional regulator
MDTAALLQQLGFGEYESRAYITLLKDKPLNGYELAKASGLPRANIYAVLQKLEKRGAVVRLDTPPDGVRYSPVPPRDLLQRLRSSYESVLESTQDALESISAPVEYEQVWNVHGHAAMLEHARSVVDSAEKNLLTAISPEEASALKDNFNAAQARGVKITNLCTSACVEQCGHCQGNIFRYSVTGEKSRRWLVIVQDEEQVLASEIGPEDETLAVLTRQQILVELISWYIYHSIALAAVLNDLGQRAEDLLQADTLSVLASLGPDGMDGPIGWLETMRKNLARSNRPAQSV